MRRYEGGVVTLRKSRIWIATGNTNKVKEAAAVLSPFGIKLEHYPFDRVEIQAEDPAEIAVYSLKQIKENVPICVEDAGIFIDHYYGFPGPYSSYFLDKLGNPGILKLMEGEKDRGARYLSVVAYRDEGGVKVFQGTVEGEIAYDIRGAKGFGYDPIFIPKEGDGRTFGEMSDDEKNTISHRARAFRKLALWLSE